MIQLCSKFQIFRWVLGVNLMLFCLFLWNRFIYYRWWVGQGCRSTCSRELSEPLASSTRSPWETETILKFYTYICHSNRWPRKSDLFFGECLSFYCFLNFIVLRVNVFGAKARNVLFGLCKIASGNIYSLKIFIFLTYVMQEKGEKKKKTMYNTSMIVYVTYLLLMLMMVYYLYTKKKILLNIVKLCL